MFFTFSGGVALFPMHNPDDVSVFDAAGSNIPTQHLNNIVGNPTQDEFWVGSGYNGVMRCRDGEWTHFRQTPEGANLWLAGEMLMVDDSTLWFHSRVYFGTPGMFQIKHGELTRLPVDASFMTQGIHSLTKAPDGSVWMSSSSHLIHYEEDGGWHFYGVETLGEMSSINKMSVAPDGTVFVLGMDFTLSPYIKLLALQEGQWQEIALPTEYTHLDYDKFFIYHSPDGHLWLYLDQAHNTLLEFDGINWTMHPLAEKGLSNGLLSQLQIDDAGRWWMTYDAKLWWHQEGVLRQVRHGNTQMQSSYVQAVAVDVLQNKWALQSGWTKFDGTQWANHPYPNYLAQESVYSDEVSVDRQGNLWRYKLPGNEWVKFDGMTYHTIPVTTYNGTGGITIRNSTLDHANRLWIVNSHRRLAYYDGQAWQHQEPFITTIFPNGPGQDDPKALSTGPEGSVWCLGHQLHRYDGLDWETLPIFTPVQAILIKGLFVGQHNTWFWATSRLYRLEGSTWMLQEEVTNAETHIPLSLSDVVKIKEDSQGNTWVASGKGLFKYDGFTWQHFHTLNSNLPGERISSMDIDNKDNIWMTILGGQLVVFNENGLTDLGSSQLAGFSGNVYYDANDNGLIDGGDFPLPNQRVFSLADSSFLFTDSQGHYIGYANPGTHIVEAAPYTGWIVAGDSSAYQVTVDTQITPGFDFLLDPLVETRTMKLHYAQGISRCHTVGVGWLQLRNTSFLTGQAQVQFAFDDLCQLESAQPSPSSIDGQTLTWDFEHILPFEQRTIRINLLMPDETHTGDTLRYEAHASGVFIDGVPAEIDTVHTHSVLYCAYDPNDKLALPLGPHQGMQVAPGTPIQYTIRFQNTGNDTAFSVILLDTLDRNLDWASFELLGYSHPMRTMLDSEGVLRFSFDDIMLPDSTTNFLESQGFVSYQIAPRLGLPLPLEVHNTAHIYFDFNAPIVTNTTRHIFFEDLSTSVHQPHGASGLLVRLMPNPTGSKVLLRFQDPVTAPVSVQMYNEMGRMMWQGKVLPTQQTQEIDLQEMPAGIYFLSLQGPQGRSLQKVVKQ